MTHTRSDSIQARLTLVSGEAGCYEFLAVFADGTTRPLTLQGRAAAAHASRWGDPRDLDGLSAEIILEPGSAHQVLSAHAFVAAAARAAAQQCLDGSIGDLVPGRSRDGIEYVFTYHPATQAARDIWGSDVRIAVQRILDSRAIVEIVVEGCRRTTTGYPLIPWCEHENDTDAS